MTLAREIVNSLPDVESRPLGENKVELVVPRDHLREVVAHIDATLEDAFPESAFGVDLGDGEFEVVYVFWSQVHRLLCQLRVRLKEPDLVVDSVCDIFPGLEWHERETHEMFGIDFRGHPDLRPLLLPDELVGKYPLRKSFKTDRSRVAESGLAQPRPRRQAQRGTPTGETAGAGDRQAGGETQ